jgi:hypothetical protein
MAVFPDLPSNTAGYFRFNGTVHIDAGLAPGPVPTVNGSGIKAQGISKVG